MSHWECNVIRLRTVRSNRKCLTENVMKSNRRIKAHSNRKCLTGIVMQSDCRKRPGITLYPDCWQLPFAKNVMWSCCSHVFLGLSKFLEINPFKGGKCHIVWLQIALLILERHVPLHLIIDCRSLTCTHNVRVSQNTPTSRDKVVHLLNWAPRD